MLVGAPWVARPIVRVIAWPFVMMLGVIGRLARQNALRVPRRTAATASALMIGLALVAGISVLAESVKASVSEGVANELTLRLRPERRRVPGPATWPDRRVPCQTSSPSPPPATCQCASRTSAP